MKTKEQKRAEALVRKAAHDALTLDQKIAKQQSFKGQEYARLCAQKDALQKKK